MGSQAYLLRFNKQRGIYRILVFYKPGREEEKNYNNRISKKRKNQKTNKT